MPNHTTLYLIDGNAADRRGLAFRLGGLGIEAWPFSDADTFLMNSRALQPRLVLLDLDSAAGRGAEFIGALQRSGNDWPIIALSGGADVPAAVDTMKLGFVDLLMKPLDEARLLGAIGAGSTLLARRLGAAVIRVAAEAKVTTLTARELSVCRGLIAGDPNKVVAYNLGISVRTVEAHRSHIMMKLDVRSIAEVCVLLAQAGKLRSEKGITIALDDCDAGHASWRRPDRLAADAIKAGPRPVQDRKPPSGPLFLRPVPNPGLPSQLQAGSGRPTRASPAAPAQARGHENWTAHPYWQARTGGLSQSQGHQWKFSYTPDSAALDAAQAG
jgi:two-component system response regulator FixJ